MIDRMRLVIRDVWAEGHRQGVADGADVEPVNPYEGRKSLAKVFEFLEAE